MHTASTAPAPVSRDADGLALIGRSALDLRGIRFRQADPADNARGSDPTPSQDPTPGATPPAAPNPGGTPSPSPSPAPNPGTGNPNPGSAPSQAVRFEDLDERTQNFVRGLRDEARQHREAAEAAQQQLQGQQQTTARVLAALGLNADGSAAAPEPAELEGLLQTAQSEREQTARENLVLRAAPGLNANADRLLDSRTFVAKLSALKVDDREGVATLIRETIENDGSYRVAPAAAASSGGTAHTGTTPTTSRRSRQEALEAKYSTAARG